MKIASFVSSSGSFASCLQWWGSQMLMPLRHGALSSSGTSDIHGNVDNYDYFTDSVPTGSSQRGLTKVYTYVKNVMAANPNTILIDDGDTIQGTPTGLQIWCPGYS